MSQARRWEQAEPHLRQKAYAALDRDPQSLLDGDGAVSAPAEVFMARLIGFDDEIVDDGLRLRCPYPDILMPLRGGRTARYALQRGHAVVTLTAEHAPPDLEPDPMTSQVRVLYLRYRRRR